MNTAPSGLHKAVQDALVAALSDDADLCAESIGVIVDGGPQHIHAALCAWSTPVLKAVDTGKPGVWGIEVIDESTGQNVGIDHDDIPPSDRDAVRIVTCFGNRDHGMIATIARTYWEAGPESVASLMVSSVRLSAAVVREQAGL